MQEAPSVLVDVFNSLSFAAMSPNRNVLLLCALVLGTLSAAWFSRLNETPTVLVPEEPAQQVGLPELRLPFAAKRAKAEFERPTVATIENSAGGIEVELADGPAEVSVEVPEGSEDERISFWCRILDDADSPIARASIKDHSILTRNYFEKPKRLRSVRSDSEGFAQLLLEPGTQGMLHVTATKYGPLLFGVSETHQTRGEALVVRMSKAATLVVHLVRRDPSPVLGARVELEVGGHFVVQGQGSARGDLAWSKITKKSGSAVFKNLPPAAVLRARVELDGQRILTEPEILPIGPGEQREVTWVIGAGTRISGNLLDQHGQPIADQQLWLIRNEQPASSAKDPIYFEPAHHRSLVAETRSDSLGRFQFDDVAGGQYHVGPAAISRSRLGEIMSDVAPIGTAFEVETGVAFAEINLVAERGLYIRGRVVLPGGESPRSLSVTAWSKLGRLYLYQRGAEFQLGPLANIEHRLTSSASGCQKSLVLESHPGEELVFELELGAELSGQFIDDSSGEPTRAELLLSRKEGEHFVSKRRFPNPEFRSGGLSPGTYHLTARNPDGLIGTLGGLEVGAGESLTGLKILMRPGASLRLVLSGGERVFRCDLELSGNLIAMESLRPGIPVLVVVPSGEITVRVFLDRKQVAVHHVSSVVGTELELEIEAD